MTQPAPKFSHDLRRLYSQAKKSRARILSALLVIALEMREH